MGRARRLTNCCHRRPTSDGVDDRRQLGFTLTALNSSLSVRARPTDAPLRCNLRINRTHWKNSHSFRVCLNASGTVSTSAVVT